MERICVVICLLRIKELIFLDKQSGIMPFRMSINVKEVGLKSRDHISRWSSCENEKSIDCAWTSLTRAFLLLIQIEAKSARCCEHVQINMIERFRKVIADRAIPVLIKIRAM